MIVSSSQHSELKSTPPSPRQNYAITYEARGYTFTVREDGRIDVSASGPGERGERVTYHCRVDIPQPPPGATPDGKPREATELEFLFGLARSQAFLNARKEYLPKKGSFAYHGHDSRTRLTLKDGNGNPIKGVVYSDRPEIQPPPEVRELGARVGSFVRHEPQHSVIEKACGPIPKLIIAID